MKLKSLALILLGLLLVSGFVPTRAQTSDTAPLIFWIEGDYWRYDVVSSEMTQLTEWGWNRQPMLSPDGTHLAYNSTPDFVVETIEREGGVGGGDLPGNIMILDLQTNESTLIAQQPEGATFLQNPNEDMVVRSMPRWSPDGSNLAWSELVYPQLTYRLGIYDIATAETKLIDLPQVQPSGVPAAPILKWGDMGIVIQNILVESSGDQMVFKDFYYVFDAEGTPITSLQGPQVPSEFFYIDFELVQWGAGEFIGILYSSGAWLLVDPNQQVPTPNYSGPMELFTPQGDGVRLFVRYTEQGFTSSIMNADGEEIPLGSSNGRLDEFTIAPNAQHIAYLSYSGIWSAYINDGATSTQLNLGGKTPLGIIWQSGQWRVPPEQGTPDAN